MSTEFLRDGPADAPRVIVLAHGAGAPMDSALLTRVARGLGERGHHVVRFEFPYMAGRRTGGPRRPPDRTDVLLRTWRDVIARVRDGRPLVIGGHSMGGRMASMVADDATVTGLVCLSYPWHPPGRPAETRTAHLRTLATRALFACGTRDEFGTPAEVSTYDLPATLQVHWIVDADHGWRARARSGRTVSDNIAEGVAAVSAFLEAA